MQTGQSAGVSLVVLDQTPTPGCPGKGAFHHPPPGQQHEASFGLWQFDDLQRDVLLFGGLSRRLVGVSLIDVGQCDALLGRLLDGLGETANRGAIIDVGGRDMQGQQMAERNHSPSTVGRTFAGKVWDAQAAKLRRSFGLGQCQGNSSWRREAG